MNSTLLELRAEYLRKIEAIDLLLGDSVPKKKDGRGRPKGSGGKKRKKNPKLAAAAKARWAKVKAAGKTSL